MWVGHTYTPSSWISARFRPHMDGWRFYRHMRLLVSPLALSLCGALLVFPATAQAKSKPTPPHPPAVTPAVIEWFSNQYPKAGERDTVYADLVLGKRGIPG